MGDMTDLIPPDLLDGSGCPVFSYLGVPFPQTEISNPLEPPEETTQVKEVVVSLEPPSPKERFQLIPGFSPPPHLCK